ncbi:MAG: ATP-binding protein [Deltaproteobacteria bacterium]|nr:ATP-binding protein [Deltaproteobacteria bacterium]
MTHMVDRILASRLIKNKTSNFIILGARQVGKSTICHSLNPVFTVDLADETAFVAYAKEPGRLKREVEALSHPGTILVDEIQRLPRLLNMIQTMIDARAPHRFLLTGSSARKLKRGGANLLPGRVILEYLDPLTVMELGDAFDLDRILQVGSLPGVYLHRETGQDILGTYATVYLREEIQAEALTREIGSYSRFLDVAAVASGQWINYSKFASDTEIPKETIRRFFSLLEDTLVAFRIPAFRPKHPSRRVTQRDRYVLFDVGVRNALLGLHERPIPSTERGNLFEQWVLLQCLYWQRAHHRSWRISSYRSDTGLEVDIVIDTGDGLRAIECKSGAVVHPSDLRGLRSFADIAGRPLQHYVVYTGTTRQQWPDNVLVIPYKEFLTEELATW